MEIAQINYDEDGPSIQTFDSVWTQAEKFAAKDDDDSSDDDEEDFVRDESEAASCSKEAASCSSPPRFDVAAITLKILENWGSTEYTCIYRFRVHGEASLR